MKNSFYKIQYFAQLIPSILLLSFLVLSLSSCEDVTTVAVQKSGVTQLVVDGFINNKPNVPQVIKLTLSQPYFDNSVVQPALNAVVYIIDQDSTRFDFKDLNNNGNYTWIPKNAQTSFGTIGKQYTLTINYQGETYKSSSKMNRVPKIDSVTYSYESRRSFNQGTDGPSTGYQPEFYARDPIGIGDCFWIKSSKNGVFFSNSKQISIAYDAAQQPGNNIDGLIFIQPVRRSIAKELFADKDTLHVEVNSITQSAFYFFTNIKLQAQNGGIFATPIANIPSNIVNVNTQSPQTALGFFCVSATSTFDTIIDKNKAVPSTN